MKTSFLANVHIEVKTRVFHYNDSPKNAWKHFASESVPWLDVVAFNAAYANDVTAKHTNTAGNDFVVLTHFVENSKFQISSIC